MKRVLLVVFFTFSICFTFAQEITFISLTDDKSEVQISNGELVKMSFGDYFKAEGETFNLVNNNVYSDSLNHNKIGQYRKKRLKKDGNKRYRYKLDNRNERVLVYDKDKNLVFEGRLIHNDKFGYLEAIDIETNETASEIIESWVVLSTLQHFYDKNNDDFINDLLLGFLIGLGISIGGGF